MEKKLLNCGRYKNKMFKYVYENDKEYCENVLSSSQNYRGDLSEFKAYLHEVFNNSLTVSDLNEKNNDNLIKEIYAKDFLAELNNKQQKEFYALIVDKTISEKIVHKGAEREKTHGILGIFYRMFIKKQLYNANGEDAYSGSCTEMLIVFPFAINWERKSDDDDDDDVSNKNKQPAREIMKYVTNDVLEEIKFYFKANGFDIEDERQDIKCMLELISVDERNNNNNDDEIKLLLNRDYMVNHREMYVKLLKKYLFFYELCKESYLNYSRKHVEWGYYFSVVDCAELSSRYENAQLYKKYTFYRGDIMDLVEDMFKLSVAINTFKHYEGQDKNGDCTWDDVDYSSLSNMSTYVENLIGGIVKTDNHQVIVAPAGRLVDYILVNRENSGADGIMYRTEDDVKRNTNLFERVLDEHVEPNYQVDPCFLSSGALFYSSDDGQLIDVCYSKRKRDSVKEFYYLIVLASLLNKPCNELVIYNPYYGTEMRMKMTANTENVRNFIRKYHHPTAWKERCVV